MGPEPSWVGELGSSGVKGWAGPEWGAQCFPVWTSTICKHVSPVHMTEVETLGACIRCELVSQE